MFINIALQTVEANIILAVNKYKPRQYNLTLFQPRLILTLFPHHVNYFVSIISVSVSRQLDVSPGAIIHLCLSITVSLCIFYEACTACNRNEQSNLDNCFPCLHIFKFSLFQVRNLIDNYTI